MCIYNKCKCFENVQANYNNPPSLLLLFLEKAENASVKNNCANVPTCRRDINQQEMTNNPAPDIAPTNKFL